jgi:DNA-binding MarR family transcriptional regulator
VSYYACVPRTKRLPYATCIPIREECLCLLLQHAARAIARRFDDKLRPFKLTNGQFALLISLNRPEASPMRVVASLLGMDRTTLTAALKPLERRGLVKASKDPQDLRNRILILTRSGRALLIRAVPIWRRTHDEIEKLMPNGGANALRRSLLASPLIEKCQPL